MGGGIGEAGESFGLVARELTSNLGFGRMSTMCLSSSPVAAFSLGFLFRKMRINSASHIAFL